MRATVCVRLAHFDELRDAEVEQLQGAIARHQDVRRLQVAMDDEVLVSRMHGRADPAEQGEPVFQARRCRSQ